MLEQLLACYPEADLFAVVDFLPPAERGFLVGAPCRKTKFHFQKRFGTDGIEIIL